MAYVKIKCVKTGTHLQQVIDYIQNPEKTDNNILISSFMCSTKNTAKQFEEISKNHRERLKKVIDLAIENSNNLDEFLGYMQHKGYEIKRGKYLYFKGVGDDVFLNTKVLGSAYIEKFLEQELKITPK